MSDSAPGPVDIILFNLEGDVDRQECLYRLLSEDERQRASRFRFDRHRIRFIFGRGTIREILAWRSRCQPQEISFVPGKFGKPRLREPETARCLHFNASSSESLGIIAISNNFALGVDIEKLKSGTSDDFDLVVQNEFTDSEIYWYRQHGEAQKTQAFYQLWTCKEAYLKALGIGLSGKLNSFSIEMRGTEPRVVDTDLEDGGKSSLCLHRLWLDGDYIACLAMPVPDRHFELSYW